VIVLNNGLVDASEECKNEGTSVNAIMFEECVVDRCDRSSSSMRSEYQYSANFQRRKCQSCLRNLREWV
jgi:transposase-like protein